MREDVGGEAREGVGEELEEGDVKSEGEAAEEVKEDIKEGDHIRLLVVILHPHLTPVQELQPLFHIAEADLLPLQKTEKEVALLQEITALGPKQI